MVKYLYILARYVPFLLIVSDTCLTLTPNENIEACRVFISIYTGFAVISLACSECFFVLRTYVLWSNNRLVLYAMLSILCAVMRNPRYPRHPRLLPDLKQCRIVLAVYSLVCVSTGTGLSHTHTYDPELADDQKRSLYCLVKHNIFYYACGLLFSALNFIVPIIFPNSPYHAFLEDFEVFILAILATRMHLHLWRIDHPCTILMPPYIFPCRICHLQSETVRCDVLSCGSFGVCRRSFGP
ncbi:hypothetical protein BDR07DRAFT_484774 [Suillus spraguei]|nr:hypothetical protein BDR07DRAFT_484774 [Suillus spraguei]